MSDPGKLKMYILVLDSVPLGHAINCNGHAVLACHLRFQNEPIYKDWLDQSYRKVTCKVSKEEFDKAKQWPDHVMITESALNYSEVALAFCPRHEWDESFKGFKLYR